MKETMVIHWFRQDLRLADNPSLYQACRKGQVLPIYILDEHNAGKYRMGGASRWWLHHSLAALNHALHGKLALFRGNPLEIIHRVAGPVSRTLLPHNVACGFPALRSSEDGSQNCKSLQLSI